MEITPWLPRMDKRDWQDNISRLCILSETFVTVMGDFGSFQNLPRLNVFRVECTHSRARPVWPHNVCNLSWRDDTCETRSGSLRAKPTCETYDIFRLTERIKVTPAALALSHLSKGGSLLCSLLRQPNFDNSPTLGEGPLCHEDVQGVPSFIPSTAP